MRLCQHPEGCLAWTEGNTDYCATHNALERKRMRDEAKTQERDKKAKRTAEMMRERAAKKQAAKEKKPQPLKARSRKGAAAERAKHKVYQQMDEEQEHYCSGCGRAGVPLSHSHLIPVGLRKDLEADPRNIVYDCLSIGNRLGCHDIWEHGTMAEKMMLANFQERMQAIKELDEAHYWKLVFRIKEEEIKIK